MHTEYVCISLRKALRCKPSADFPPHDHKADYMRTYRNQPAYRIRQIQRLRCMKLLVHAEKCKYPQ